MKNWLFLLVAIIAEVFATSALKSSEGFTRLWPTVLVVLGYGISFYFLSYIFCYGTVFHSQHLHLTVQYQLIIFLPTDR